jgi:large conductance mechanosensitive channel
MKNFLGEFKTFALRGNVVELAVAVVIGAAFGEIVSSLVDNLIMPAISLFFGVVNLSSLQLQIGMSVIQYGVFLQSVLDFILVALAVFLMIKILNRSKRIEAWGPEQPSASSEDTLLLREIRDVLRNQK